MKILLVDDHRLVRECLRQCLEEHYPDVIQIVAEADDGEHALRVIRTEGPDAVVTDVNMPGIDGITLTRMIRKERPRIPILIITTSPEQWLVEQAKEAGAAEVLAKTASSDAFCEAVLRLRQA